MSIIIHFNAASFIPSSVTLPSVSSCISRAKTKLTMVPGIDQTDRTVMTDDENSMVDIATSNTLYTHAINDLKSNHVFGSCFGLPYQDHNYGAPPPPTPPNYSPCNSPPHANGVPDEDTNLSVVSTSTANEETQDASITRCICGFEHDDEYMICCDNCLVWQHVDCMGLDRNNIPETYLCEKCQPRKVDRHKAKVLQTRKKIRMTDSSDSDDDHGKNSEKKTRTRSRRKRKEEEKGDKSEHGSSRRSRNMQKHKERMEAKSARLRRTKNKESTSTADEEAQDAWEISLEWCEKNFETAVTNQYTPEVQHLARTLPIQVKGHERRFMELLVTKHCKIVDGNEKRLISIYDIPRNQPLIEYVGKFLLASQFYELHPAFSKRLYPFVMFYSLDKEEICVDASVYGNEARFVRRSCKPNAELHHLVYNGNLHLYISSTKAVFKDDEITLPLEFNLKESIKDMECACESDDCILKFHQKNSSLDLNEKRKRGRKLTFSADDDSSHSFVGVNTSPTKSKPSLAKSTSQTGDHTDGKSDHETEEQANERRKKTREERKIDAIMRAFDQMEKAAKRRQQALERQKAHQPKSEESSDKPELLPIPKEEDKLITASGSETQGGEDEKIHIPTPKPKKGKRRRGSGTSSRRRTRTNSGGSDILLLEETVQPQTVPTTCSEVVENPEASLETSNVTTTCSSTASVASVSTAAIILPVLKTKRLLLHEWLQQEKSETNTNPPATTPPVAVRTEVKRSPTCYVQCTKDNPQSSGISAAHLRRSSTSGPIKSYPIKSCNEQGSAKKRWLRQAMYDNNSHDDPLIIDPGGMDGLHLDNGDLSPDGHGEMGSPGAADGTVTPLKKRRLMRESLESTSSPLSPAPHSSEGTNSLLSVASVDIKTEIHSSTSGQQVSTGLDYPCMELTIKLEENVQCNVKNIKVEHKNPEESVIKEEESTLDTCMDTSLSLEPESIAEISSATVLPECTGVELSMQIDCDHEVKNTDTIKNGGSQGDLDLLQNDSIDNNVGQSAHVCSGENIQSNLQTPNSNIPVLVQSGLNESTTQTNSVKKKLVLPGEQLNTLPCSTSEGSSDCAQEVQSDFMKSNNKVSASSVEMTYFDTKSEHSTSKSEESVNKVLSDSSVILPVNSDGTKDSFSDSAPQSPKLHTSVSPVKDVNAFVSVSFNCRNEQFSSVDTPKMILTNVSITEPEVLCCNSLSSDHVNSNHEKFEEHSDLDCKFSHLSNENSSLAVKATCASATQKRKVSLSEYRMRMKDGTSKRSFSDVVKRSISASSVSATAIPETLPEQVTLAPLPLFDTITCSQSPPQPAPVKACKKKKEVVKIEESFNDEIEHRENLTERLKREFGFDEDSDDCILTSNTMKTVSSGASSALPPNAQPPPPPPPPPPRSSRPLQSGMNVTAAAVSPSQFGFSMQASYARPSYIVPQVPSAQFIPVQQAVTAPIMPSVHPATTTVMQCNIRTPLLQSPHSFTSSLPGSILQQPIQHEYSSVNAQSYAALVQQPPPPPPPPKSYSHVYQPGLYK